jgi:hypothetical protein
MQTNNIIILVDNQFVELEESELEKTKFIAKPKEKITPIVLLLFNKCILSQKDNIISLYQKKQGKKIKLINADFPNFRQVYIK